MEKILKINYSLMHFIKRGFRRKSAVGLSMATAYASDQTQAFVFAHFFKTGSPFQSLSHKLTCLYKDIRFFLFDHNRRYCFSVGGVGF